jgi:hypothetical protein
VDVDAPRRVAAEHGREPVQQPARPHLPPGGLADHPVVLVDDVEDLVPRVDRVRPLRRGKVILVRKA